MTSRQSIWRTLVAGALFVCPAARFCAAADQPAASPIPPVIARLLAESHRSEGNDARQSLQKATQAVAEARVHGLSAAELAGLLQLGESMRLVNDYPGALRVAQEGILLARTLQDDATRGELLLLRGTVEWNQAKVPEAMVSMMEAYQIGETLENKHLQLGALFGQGLVRARSDDLDRALAYFEAARGLAEETGDDRLGVLLNAIGCVYLQHKNYPLARGYFERSLVALKPTDNQRVLAYAMLNLGQLYTETGDQEKAGQILNDALAICGRFQLRRGTADIYYLLAARSRRLGRYDESLHLLDQSRAIAETLNNPDLFVSIYQEYIQTEQARGDYQTALRYTQQLAAQMEVVRGEKARREATEIQARYEAEGRSRQIKLLQQDRELQRAAIAVTNAQLGQARTRYTELTVVLALGLVSAATFVRSQRVRVRLTAQTLAETRVAKEEVEAADARKAGLLTIAARDLRESEVRFRSAFEFSPLGVALVGLRGQWLRVNPALCRIVDYEEPELLASNFQSLTHPDDLAEDVALAEQLLAGRIGSYSLEKRYRRKGGQAVWVRLDVSLVRDPTTGDPLYFVSQVQDIGERRRAQEQLRCAKEEAERANAAKNEFLSRMSHELRTPLNAIIGFGQLLELDDFGERQNQSVAHILAGGRHLLELINEVLDIARIESGHFHFACAPTSVHESLHNAVNLLHPLAAQAKVEIVADWARIDPDLHVDADPRRLRQILLNLLSNGIKYNRPQGRVQVRCQADEGRVRVEIEDTGVGMAADDLARVFEPFTRLPQTERVPGTGLGLSLSRGLVEAMGGHLTVRSEPGRGSTFTLELVRSATAESPGSELEALLHSSFL